MKKMDGTWIRPYPDDSGYDKIHISYDVHRKELQVKKRCILYPNTVTAVYSWQANSFTSLPFNLGDAILDHGRELLRILEERNLYNKD